MGCVKARISYTYPPDGLRTSKTVNGMTTKYHVMNGTLLGQTKGSDTIVFLYDEKGNKYGFDYNGTKYYYIFNVQGDVIGILNQAGRKIVSYTYDPWGKVLSVDGSEASTIGQLNPIRCRGYYYDTETGFYYLQSRYYDPTTRRFLNSDILVGNVGSVGQNNLFQYCSNNPVNLADPTGYLVGEIAVCLLFVAVVASIPAVIGAGASTALPSIDIPWEWPAIEPPARPETFSPPAAEKYVPDISDSIVISGEIASSSSETKFGKPNAGVYYGAKVINNKLSPITGPMSRWVAHRWVWEQNQSSTGKDYWGVYTYAGDSAYTFASFYCKNGLFPIMHDQHGEYAHYHVKPKSVVKRFHVWFGVPLA